MEKNQYFFQVRKVTNKLVTIDKDILTKQITGLFLQNSIRFYDKVLEYRTPILDKDLRKKVREIYSIQKIANAYGVVQGVKGSQDRLAKEIAKRTRANIMY